MELLKQSHDTLHVAHYQGKQALEIVSVYSIRLVIGMVPFMLSAEEESCPEIRARYFQHYFVAESPMTLFLGAEDQAIDCAEEEEMEESEGSEKSEENTDDETEGTEDKENDSDLE